MSRYPEQGRRRSAAPPHSLLGPFDLNHALFGAGPGLFKRQGAGYQVALLFDKSGRVTRILITRPQPGADETARKIAAMGHEPILAPLLSVHASAPLRVPAGFAATVLTSRNAISACPAECHSRPVFTVGSATAKRARQSGFITVIDADADASALPGLVARTLGADGRTLFLPTGLGQGKDLARALRAAGFRVIRRVAYHAAPVAMLPDGTANHLQQQDIGTALFFSAETARTFVRLVQAEGLADGVSRTEAVSISERTAMPLRALPWRQVRVADKPNQDAMLVLLT
jgi:uroporphyrinogen-III synthase